LIGYEAEQVEEEEEEVEALLSCPSSFLFCFSGVKIIQGGGAGATSSLSI
jgi:hypothetical protein